MSLLVIMQEPVHIQEAMWIYLDRCLEHMIAKLSSIQEKLYNPFHLNRYELLNSKKEAIQK
jgi:hypothetical protein